MAGSISQGLHASAVACAHRLGDICIGQWQATSANFYMHLTWPVRFGQATSDVECTQWSAASKLGWNYRQWPAHIGQPMSDGATTIVRGLHTSVFQRRTRPVRIVRGLHTSVSRRRTCPTRIICSMHTSLFRSRTWPARIVCGLHLLDERRLTRRQ